GRGAWARQRRNPPRRRSGGRGGPPFAPQAKPWNSSGEGWAEGGWPSLRSQTVARRRSCAPAVAEQHTKPSRSALACRMVARWSMLAAIVAAAAGAANCTGDEGRLRMSHSENRCLLLRILRYGRAFVV